MDKTTRLNIYSFLSKMFADILDKRLISDLKDNKEMLELLGEDTTKLFSEKNLDELYDLLNIDYSSTFLMNCPPFESSILDNKSEVLIGLQSPVMQFYFTHGYEINLTATHITTPDHISIEFGFMQNLVYRDELKIQKEFLEKHILEWIPQYLIGIKDITETVFYKDLAEFTIDFIMTDYDNLIASENKNG